MTDGSELDTRRLKAAATDADWLRRFRRGVLRWYDLHGRELPWRGTRDPYVVWISEVMLQQTTVAAVRPYFERFVARFPDVATLAAADEADVLRLWEGLGYYSRGRNLHRAARAIVEERGGTFPRAAVELESLPGIGRYTAAAIASFAFGERAGIVEANTLRLYARLLGYDGDPRSTAGQRLLWDFADRIVPRERVGDFNHALMDLGATVCTVAEPACAACPVRSCCRAFAEGRQAEIPPAKRRVAPTEVTEATVAVERRGRFLLRRRGADERWAGLWDFPRFELDPLVADESRREPPRQSSHPERGHDDDALTAAIVEGVREIVGVTCEPGERVAEIRHGVTRFRIRLLCHRARHVCGRPRGETRWVTPAEFDALPLSTTGRRFARLLS